LIPEKNVKDLEEIPHEIKNSLEVIPVKTVDQVLEIALESKPLPFTMNTATAPTPIEPLASQSAVITTTAAEPLRPC
ncbi:MAG: S16 family serine protease, partial [Burkholderiales bacterium]